MKITITPRAVVLAVLMLAGLAFATAATGPFGIYTKVQAWLGGGAYIGSSAVGSTANKVTQVLYAGQDFNFDAGQVGDVRWGPPITITGAKVGDQCIMSTDLNALGTNDQYDCWVQSTNTVNFRIITHATNNDPGDAGFYFRVISNQ